MKLIATLLFVAAFAACTYAQVPIPPTYQGPVASPATNAFAGANVNIVGNNFVLQWSESTITMIRAARIGLFNFTRILALVHVSMHDTIQGFEQRYATYQSGLPLPGRRANVQAAVTGAGYTILATYFANNVVELSKYTSILIYQQDVLRLNGVKASRIAEGFLYGQTVALALLAQRANDGFNVIPTFIPQSGPGFWRPTPPNFAPAAGQGWGAVTPWGLTQPIANFFPADGNTYFVNGSRYIVDYLEVLGRGRDTNAKQVTTLQRTGVETFIGVFWANDFGGTSLPPGQYIQTAWNVGSDLNRGNFSRLLALVALQIANTNIVTWAVKYTFQEWRPVAAIQEAGADTYAETIGDPSWVPLSITTPAFPDYVSGHASFGFGLAQIFRRVRGTDNFSVTSPSDNLPQVTANYRKFSDLALDNSLSRIFLGVHFRAALDDAQFVGDSIANDVYDNLLRPL